MLTRILQGERADSSPKNKERENFYCFNINFTCSGFSWLLRAYFIIKIKKQL